MNPQQFGNLQRKSQQYSNDVSTRTAVPKNHGQGFRLNEIDLYEVDPYTMYGETYDEHCNNYQYDSAYLQSMPEYYSEETLACDYSESHTNSQTKCKEEKPSSSSEIQNFHITTSIDQKR